MRLQVERFICTNMSVQLHITTYILNFDRWEEWLNHQRRYLVRVVFLFRSEAIHNQKRSCLQISGEALRMTSVSLLKLDHVFRKSVLIDLENHGWSLGVLDYPEVISIFCLRNNHHVWHSKLARCTHEIFDRVLLRFLQIRRSVGVHQVSHVLKQFFEVDTDFSSFDYKRYKLRWMSWNM